MRPREEAESYSQTRNTGTRRPWRMVIELYCGSCSFATYLRSQLEPSEDASRDVDIWHLCVDRRSQ